MWKASTATIVRTVTPLSTPYAISENIPVKDSHGHQRCARYAIHYTRHLIVFNDFKNEMLLLEMLFPAESELDKVRKPFTTAIILVYDFVPQANDLPLTDEDTKPTSAKE